MGQKRAGKRPRGLLVGGGTEAEATVKAMLFSKGETRLNGKHENIICYLEKLPRNVKKLDYNLEKKIAKAIWALTKGAVDEDHDTPPMSATFFGAMVTPERQMCTTDGPSALV